MVPRAIFVLAALALGATLKAALLADATSQDAQWFSKSLSRDKRYYEGVLDQPNAKQAYEVIGFFASAGSNRDPLDAHPPKNSQLHAWFYLPSEDLHSKPKSVTIRVKQIASRTNYLMQSRDDAISPKPGEWDHFDWSTDTIIYTHKIDASSLGVIARLDSHNPDKDDIAPVILCLQCKDEEITHYELFLKIQRYSLSDLRYEIRIPGSAKPTTCYFTISDPCVFPRPRQNSPIEVGTVIKLPLSVIAPTGEVAPAGEVTVHITGQYKDSSEQLELTYKFFHEPVFRGKP